MEQVELCDTVIIEHEKIGVDIQTKVISTEYDTLAERYNSIELGETNSTLENTIGGINHTASSASTKDDIRTMESDLKNAIVQQANTLTGVNGGYVITHRDIGSSPIIHVYQYYILFVGLYLYSLFLPSNLPFQIFFLPQKNLYTLNMFL